MGIERIGKLDRAAQFRACFDADFGWLHSNRHSRHDIDPAAQAWPRGHGNSGRLFRIHCFRRRAQLSSLDD